MAAANVTLHVAEIEIHNQTVSLQQMDGPEIPIIRYTTHSPLTILESQSLKDDMDFALASFPGRKTNIESCKHHFMMQPFQNPPLCSQNRATIGIYNNLHPPPPPTLPLSFLSQIWVTPELGLYKRGTFVQTFPAIKIAMFSTTLSNTVCCDHRNTYLEQQKLETKVRDVDRIRITKVSVCCPGWPEGEGGGGGYKSAPIRHKQCICHLPQPPSPTQRRSI
jgi:hypothetical protein